MMTVGAGGIADGVAGRTSHSLSFLVLFFRAIAFLFGAYRFFVYLSLSFCFYRFLALTFFRLSLGFYRFLALSLFIALFYYRGGVGAVVCGLPPNKPPNKRFHLTAYRSVFQGVRARDGIC